MSTLEKQGRQFDLSELETSTFCCSGVVPTSVVVFFEDESEATHKITFPGCSEKHLEELMKACVPASFGKGKEEVYDETYRKARVLDPDHFSTNFHLAELDILALIEKILVPGRKICAKLYKLNVYAKDGMFKSHVDTPRSQDMIGSLVVCLPSGHAGGHLVIKNNKEVQSFDLSSPNEVKWVAFFGDCEHEVLRVTKGYRVTLTFNLHVVKTQEVVQITGIEETVAYKRLGDILSQCKKPTVLGFHCVHDYSTDVFKDFDEHCLKGSDQILYLAAKKLGLVVSFVQVLDVDDKDWHEDEDEDDVELKGQEKSTSTEYTVELQPKFNVNSRSCYEYEEGEKWQDFVTSSFNAESTRVKWCNEAKNRFITGAFATYGNVPSIGALYCKAALFIKLEASENIQNKQKK
eukprot:TRINITY_DN669_c0_g1_i3.p1 TRINITY_DN669_c0_g1~~TRINITY_DN669_c0_g1_i3.p1  ORF type:complete len:406 (-),score=96.54 TRINITY_DN669_c0_g1_i3:116-1333(-)